MVSALVVDNGVLFRKMLKKALETHIYDIVVEEAENGSEALQKISVQPYDVILMEVHLPGKSGFQVTKEIKAASPDTSIVILADCDYPEYLEAASQSGADYFVSKAALSIKRIAALIQFMRLRQDTVAPGVLRRFQLKRAMGEEQA